VLAVADQVFFIDSASSSKTLNAEKLGRDNENLARYVGA
jgi:hypothetical protein